MDYESSVQFHFEVIQQLENSTFVLLLYQTNMSMLKDEVVLYKQLLTNAKYKNH
jgi:hypothetical protein